MYIYNFSSYLNKNNILLFLNLLYNIKPFAICNM